MEAQLEPLETRSLPGALWEHAPLWLKENDEHLRAWFASHVDGSVSPWREFRWLTESNLGIALFVVGFALTYFVIVRKYESRSSDRKKIWRVQGLRVATVGALAVLSNVVSMGLKQVFGRFKPHVNWWDKAAPAPALSFPSSHAFNTAFLLVIIWLLMSSATRRRWKHYLVTLSFFVFVVGLSRVVFTQHYPLDVLAGWILGALLAYVLAPFAQKWIKSERVLGESDRAEKH